MSFKGPFTFDSILPWTVIRILSNQREFFRKLLTKIKKLSLKYRIFFLDQTRLHMDHQDATRFIFIAPWKKDRGTERR
jgi:hypothetical protein